MLRWYVSLSKHLLLTAGCLGRICRSQNSPDSRDINISEVENAVHLPAAKPPGWSFMISPRRPLPTLKHGLCVTLLHQSDWVSSCTSLGLLAVMPRRFSSLLCCSVFMRGKVSCNLESVVFKCSKRRVQTYRLHAVRSALFVSLYVFLFTFN